jgi:hypothetical protein
MERDSKTMGGNGEWGYKEGRVRAQEEPERKAYCEGLRD